jgi:hypothetical protein
MRFLREIMNDRDDFHLSWDPETRVATATGPGGSLQYSIANGQVYLGIDWAGYIQDDKMVVDDGTVHAALGDEGAKDESWMIAAAAVGGVVVVKGGGAVAAVAATNPATVNKAVELSDKIVNQMGKRGWDANAINNVVTNSNIIREATNKATGNPATAYFTPDGAYVVVDNITKVVIQISNRFDPNWIPDPTIVNPYIP